MADTGQRDQAGRQAEEGKEVKINSCICDGSASVGKFNHGTTLNNVPWIDWFVKCSRCERGIPGGTKKEAIQLWNSVNPIHDQPADRKGKSNEVVR
jgi:hypothetical protein